MSWHQIKLDRVDILFSKYIRLRDKKCQRCGRKGTGKEGIAGLQNSHFFSRRKESTRFDELNCDTLCAGCHKFFTEHRTEFEDWKQKRMSIKEYNLLELRANTPVKKDRKMALIIVKELLKSKE